MADSSPWGPVAERLLPLLREGQSAEAFAILDGRPVAEGDAAPPADDPAPGFRQVGMACYWKHRSLPAFLVLAREEIRRLEEALAGSADPARRARLVRRIGGTHYNLAAFTWPGWDEPEIRVGEAEARLGGESARRCLEVRLDPAHREFEFGYTPAMAHWVVGAHCLEQGDRGAAREQFEAARTWNAAAGQDTALDRGYLALTDLLERPGEEAPLLAVLEELETRTGDEDAPFIRDQLRAARRYYERRAG